MTAIKANFRKALRHLRIVMERLEAAYGDIDELWLGDLIDDVRRHGDEFDEFIEQRDPDYRDPLLD